MNNLLCCLQPKQQDEFPSAPSQGHTYNYDSKNHNSSTMYSTLAQSTAQSQAHMQMEARLRQEKANLANRRYHIEGIYSGLKDRLFKLKAEYANQEHRLFEINQIMNQLNL